MINVYGIIVGSLYSHTSTHILLLGGLTFTSVGLKGVNEVLSHPLYALYGVGLREVIMT